MVFPKTAVHPVKNCVRWGMEVGDGRWWMKRLGWAEREGRDGDGSGRVVIARRVKVEEGERRR